MTPADRVAEIMARETEIPHVERGRPYRGRRHKGAEIADELGLQPSYVRYLQTHIRKALGAQAV